MLESFLALLFNFLSLVCFFNNKDDITAFFFKAHGVVGRIKRLDAYQSILHKMEVNSYYLTRSLRSGSRDKEYSKNVLGKGFEDTVLIRIT